MTNSGPRSSGRRAGGDPATPPKSKAPAARFGWVNLDGPVHFADFGGPPDGPAVVLVHGLGGSHATWMAAGPLLAARARVVAVDLAGFGYSPLAGRSAAVEANRLLLDRFLGEVVGEPAILVGNSMGGTVTVLEAAAVPDRVTGVVLVDPAVYRPLGMRVDWAVVQRYLPLLTPVLGEATLRDRWARGADRIVADTLAICCVDPSRVPAGVVETMVAVWTEVLGYPNSRRAYLEAFRSVMAATESRSRFSALVRSVPQPVLIVHGEEDRIVPLAAVLATRQVRPDWDMVVFPDIGHIPQAEASVHFAAVVLEWLERRRLLRDDRLATKPTPRLQRRPGRANRTGKTGPQ
jgi:pimeloyl-ACP methyl ester carboxylesterase